MEVEGTRRKEEEQKGHTDQQVAPPKYTSDPSSSSDYTEPFHNSIILGPTLIDLSMKRRMWDYAFLGDCNRLMEVGMGGSVCLVHLSAVSGSFPRWKEGGGVLTSLVKVRSAGIDSLKILP